MAITTGVHGNKTHWESLPIRPSRLKIKPSNSIATMAESAAARDVARLTDANCLRTKMKIGNQIPIIGIKAKTEK